MHELFERLRSLQLPVGEFAVFGSGPLLVRGVIPESQDLDIVCRKGAWEKVTAIGTTEYLKKYDVTVVTMFDGKLTFGTDWGIGNFDVDELINSAETIDGLPFVRLEHVINYKLERSSPKDLAHIEALRSYETDTENRRQFRGQST